MVQHVVDTMAEIRRHSPGILKGVVLMDVFIHGNPLLPLPRVTSTRNKGLIIRCY